MIKGSSIFPLICIYSKYMLLANYYLPVFSNTDLWYPLHMYIMPRQPNSDVQTCRGASPTPTRQYSPNVETCRGASLPHGEFNATDFIHYIFICVNITIVPTYHRTPMAAYVQYVLLAWTRVSSSQQGGVKVDTGGCCCPHGRVLASQHPGLGHRHGRPWVS